MILYCVSIIDINLQTVSDFAKPMETTCDI